MEPRPSSRSFSRLQRLTSDSGESEYRPRPRRFGDAPPFSGDAVAVASSTAASSVACTSLEISVDVVDTADARAAAGTAPDETVDDPALDAAAAWAFTAAAYSGVERHVRGGVPRAKVERARRRARAGAGARVGLAAAAAETRPAAVAASMPGLRARRGGGPVPARRRRPRGVRARHLRAARVHAARRARAGRPGARAGRPGARAGRREQPAHGRRHTRRTARDELFVLDVPGHRVRRHPRVLGLDAARGVVVAAAAVNAAVLVRPRTFHRGPPRPGRLRRLDPQRRSLREERVPQRRRGHPPDDGDEPREVDEHGDGVVIDVVLHRGHVQPDDHHHEHRLEDCRGGVERPQLELKGVEGGD
eukprot:31237-Pelagococcus_subviridis.AAC.11